MRSRVSARAGKFLGRPIADSSPRWYSLPRHIDFVIRLSEGHGATALRPSQMNTRLNHSVIASLSCISLLGLTACSSSSERGTGGSGGTSSNALSSTVTNGTTFFDSEPACFCPPSSSYCAGIVAIRSAPLNAVNTGVPGYQYCYLTPAARMTNPSTYICWNCADAG